MLVAKANGLLQQLLADVGGIRADSAEIDEGHGREYFSGEAAFDENQWKHAVQPVVDLVIQRKGRKGLRKERNVLL